MTAIAADSTKPLVASWTRILEILSLWTLAMTPMLLVISGEGWRRGVIVQFVDVMLTAMFVLGAPTVFNAVRRRRTSVTAAAAALLCALVISAAIHPFSTIGLATVLRFSGIVTLVHVISTGSEKYLSSVVKLWFGLTVMEATVVFLQRLLGRRIGFPGEVGDPFQLMGRFKIPTGTLSGPHPVASVGLVALVLAFYATHHRIISRNLGLVGAGSGAAIVGMTCGTSGAFSLAAVFVAATIAGLRSRKSDGVCILPLLALAVALFAVTALWSIDGWRQKADRTTTSLEQAGNGRVAMMEESVAMMKRWPVFGFGPGRFMAERDNNPDLAALATEDQPVHNVAMLIVNESGLVGAAALAAMALALARRMKRHAFSVVLLCGMSGHVLFDHAPWTFGSGMVFLALVIGFAGRDRDFEIPVNKKVSRSSALVSP